MPKSLGVEKAHAIMEAQKGRKTALQSSLDFGMLMGLGPRVT
jgi:hypothetical protein